MNNENLKTPEIEYLTVDEITSKYKGQFSESEIQELRKLARKDQSSINPDLIKTPWIPWGSWIPKK